MKNTFVAIKHLPNSNGTVMGKKRNLLTFLSFYSMNIYGDIYYDKNVTLVDKFFYQNYGARI